MRLYKHPGRGCCNHRVLELELFAPAQVSPAGLAERVLPYTASRSPKQRGAAAAVLLACVKRMGPSNLASAACEPFLKAAGAYLSCNRQCLSLWTDEFEEQQCCLTKGSFTSAGLGASFCMHLS